MRHGGQFRMIQFQHFEIMFENITGNFDLTLVIRYN